MEVQAPDTNQTSGERRAQLICEIRRHGSGVHSTDMVTAHGMDLEDLRNLKMVFKLDVKDTEDAAGIQIKEVSHMDILNRMTLYHGYKTVDSKLVHMPAKENCDHRYAILYDLTKNSSNFVKG